VGDTHRCLCHEGLLGLGGGGTPPVVPIVAGQGPVLRIAALPRVSGLCMVMHSVYGACGCNRLIGESLRRVGGWG
jgi:hypothetical protein